MPKSQPAAEEVDLTVYAAKSPTSMHERFSDWLLEETGYDPATAKSKAEAFRRGVSLGGFLRPTFQASDANRAGREEAKAERQAEEKAAKPAKAAKAVKAAPATEAPKPAAPKGKGGPRKSAPKAATEDANSSPF